MTTTQERARKAIANTVVGDTYDPATGTYPDKLVGEYYADRILAALAAAGIKCLEREPSGEMVAAANNPKNADWDEIWYPMWDAAGTEFADG